MFARVSTYTGTSDEIDEAIRQVRENTLAKLKQLEGYKGAYLIVDRQNGKSLAVTLWESEEAMSTSEERRTACVVRSPMPSAPRWLAWSVTRWRSPRKRAANTQDSQRRFDRLSRRDPHRASSSAVRVRLPMRGWVPEVPLESRPTRTQQRPRVGSSPLCS